MLRETITGSATTLTMNSPLDDLKFSSTTAGLNSTISTVSQPSVGSCGGARGLTIPPITHIPFNSLCCIQFFVFQSSAKVFYDESGFYVLP